MVSPSIATAPPKLSPPRCQRASVWPPGDTLSRRRSPTIAAILVAEPFASFWIIPATTKSPSIATEMPKLVVHRGIGCRQLRDLRVAGDEPRPRHLAHRRRRCSEGRRGAWAAFWQLCVAELPCTGAALSQGHLHTGAAAHREQLHWGSFARARRQLRDWGCRLVQSYGSLTRSTALQLSVSRFWPKLASASL